MEGPKLQEENILSEDVWGLRRSWSLDKRARQMESTGLEKRERKQSKGKQSKNNKVTITVNSNSQIVITITLGMLQTWSSGANLEADKPRAELRPFMALFSDAGSTHHLFQKYLSTCFAPGLLEQQGHWHASGMVSKRVDPLLGCAPRMLCSMTMCDALTPHSQVLEQ
jgi:hypothetical protein